MTPIEKTMEKNMEEVNPMTNKILSRAEELPDPIEAIKFRMEQMGWDNTTLAKLTGYGKPKISDFLNRKRKLSLAFIRAYHAVVDATPLDVLIQNYELNLRPRRGKGRRKKI